MTAKRAAPIAGMWVGQGTNALSGLAGDPSPFTSNANGRYEISGIDPAIRDLVVMAVPKPGQPYFMAKASVGEKSGAMIDCLRGIPFRLKLVDEAGEPAEGEVESHPVTPNPHAVSVLPHEWTFGFPISRALMTAKGVYEGVVIAGPGAVMVRTPGRTDYRPAHVDPKTFFAPGKSDWSDQDLISAYGTHDTLSIGNAQADQHDYAAIVLLNAPLDSKPLELSATVVRDRPRQVTILDPEGKPVVGVKPVGLTGFTWDDEPALRAATVPITKLHPTRSRRITFIKGDRKQIGFLLARGDGEAPYTVRLEPWATVTGRVVDENGNPFPPRFRRLDDRQGRCFSEQTADLRLRRMTTRSPARFPAAVPTALAGFASSDWSRVCATVATSITRTAHSPGWHSRTSCSSRVKLATWATFAGRNRLICAASDDAFWPLSNHRRTRLRFPSRSNICIKRAVGDHTLWEEHCRWPSNIEPRRCGRSSVSLAKASWRAVRMPSSSSGSPRSATRMPLPRSWRDTGPWSWRSAAGISVVAALTPTTRFRRRLWFS